MDRSSRYPTFQSVALASTVAALALESASIVRNIWYA